MLSYLIESHENVVQHEQLLAEMYLKRLRLRVTRTSSCSKQVAWRDCFISGGVLATFFLFSRFISAAIDVGPKHSFAILRLLYAGILTESYLPMRYGNMASCLRQPQISSLTVRIAQFPKIENQSNLIPLQIHHQNGLEVDIDCKSWNMFDWNIWSGIAWTHPILSSMANMFNVSRQTGALPGKRWPKGRWEVLHLKQIQDGFHKTKISAKVFGMNRP